MATWWLWPRGDARFVGTWLYSPYDDRFPEMELVLYRNGQGCFRDSSRPGKRWMLNWRIGGGRLELLVPAGFKRGVILRWISQSISRWTGAYPIERSDLYNVIDMTPRQIQMRRVRSGRPAYPSTLTRVSE